MQLAQGDFGDPVNGTTTYTLCVYDQAAGLSVFKMGVTVARGGVCGTTLCWKAVSDKGWSYKNRSGSVDGITKAQLKGGAAGKPQVQVQAKGASLPMPAPVSGTEFFDQDPAVIVQLHSSRPGELLVENVWLFEKGCGWITETIPLRGAEPRMGFTFVRDVRRCGVAAPSMRLESVIGGGAEQRGVDAMRLRRMGFGFHRGEQIRYASSCQGELLCKQLFPSPM